MRQEVTTVDELREIVGHPNSYVANKVGKRLSAAQQDWLAHSPLGFVPSVARLAQAVKKDMSLAELEKYYADENMRKVLY